MVGGRGRDRTGDPLLAKKKLVAPGSGVGAGGSRLEHVGGGGFQGALGKGEAAFARGGTGRAAVAVGLVDAVIEGGVGVRVGSGVEEFLHEVHGTVEVVSVGSTDGDVEFALEFGAESGPVALEDGGEVIVLVPVGGDIVIDDAGVLIPDFGGVAIGADGAEDGLPDVPLLARAAVGTKDEFPAIGAFGGGEDLARRRAHLGLEDAAEGTAGPVGVFVFVDVDHLIGVEVHGVGTGAPGPVEIIRIEDLRGERFPATGRAAVEGTGPALADAAELLFDGGDEFAIDGFAVGADVGGIDGVGVIVIRIGVLDEEEQHARELAGGPVLIELVARLRDLESEARQARVGRRGAEAVEVVGEMALIDQQRIVGIGMRRPAFGKDNDGAEVHRMAPKFGEDLALHFDVLDPFRVFGRFDGRNDFGEMDLDGSRVCGGRIDVDFFRDAVQVAGLGVPVLAFAFIHGELDGVAVGAVEGGVFVEDALDPVVASGEIVKARDGIAEGVVVDEGGLAGGEGVNVGAEDLLGADFDFEDLVARLGVVGSGDDYVDATVDWSGAESGAEGNGEAGFRRRGDRFFVRRARWRSRSGNENGGPRREPCDHGDAHECVAGERGCFAA
jgi:hypothetical protein